MMEQQKQTGGFLPEQDDSEDNTLDVEDVLRQHEEVEKLNYNNIKARLARLCVLLCRLKIGCSTSFPILPLQN